MRPPLRRWKMLPRQERRPWVADEWIGSVVKIVEGTGKNQYRTITDNDTDTLTVSPAWDTIQIPRRSTLSLARISGGMFRLALVI